MISHADNRKTAETRTRRGSSATLRDALWLAMQDMRVSWISFPATVVVSFVFGLMATPQYSNAFSEEMGAFGGFVLDFYLICLVSILSTNLIFNRDYYSSLRIEAFDERLSFLKGLPVSARSIIAGRAVSSLVSLACAAPPFFLAPYLVNGALREAIGGVDYLWFAGTWLGYALLVAGGFIFSSFGFRWEPRRMPLLFVASLAGYVSITTAVNLILADGLTMTLIESAKTHGPLAALFSIFSGSVALFLLARVSEKRLQRRDIG